MNPHVENAIKDKEKRKIKPSFDLPMHEFIPSCSRQLSQWYGPAIINKVIKDHPEKIVKVSTKEKAGDIAILCNRTEYDPILDKYVDIGYRLNIEGKVSFTDIETGTTHAVTHIRSWHKMSAFLIILVDQEDRFRTRYYILPKDYVCSLTAGSMNNTKDENKHNEFVDGRFTINKEEAYTEFDKRNLLKGTSYKDLTDYITYLSSSVGYTLSKPKQEKKRRLYRNSIVSASVNPVVNTNRRIPHAKPIKFAFELYGSIIEGETNRDTIIKLVETIGVHKAIKFFPKCWLSNVPNQFRTYKMGESNYYLNPRLSTRDVKSIINKGNKRSRLNIKLIED
jgi:hypothetical protein